MYEKLKVLASQRIQNIGKCESCLFNVHWLENGNWEWECGHFLFPKIQSFEDSENFGNTEICPLWEPVSIEICSVHKEPYLINSECSQCVIQECHEYCIQNLK